jgi:predicted enzyme related to lactoylglutathione lyase
MKIKGVGGIFVKAKDPDKLYEWYQDHLGLERCEQGGILIPTERLLPNYQIVNFVPTNTSYLSATSTCMLNFQVDNLSQLLSSLLERGARVDDHLEESDNGRFGWVYDLEGNKIELWEPRPYLASDLITLPEAE